MLEKYVFEYITSSHTGFKEESLNNSSFIMNFLNDMKSKAEFLVLIVKETN